MREVEVESFPELRVDAVPETRLVHVVVGRRVLTVDEARELARRLDRAASRAARTARLRPRGRASAAA